VNPGPSRARRACHARLPFRAGGLGEGAFTLIELLVVISIIAILLVLMAPAFTTLKSAGDVTNAAYGIQGLLDNARTYAKANNTYTWVGFYEENATATTPTNATPAYPGKGRVLLAVVSSNDGTGISLNPLPSTRITQIGKLVRIEGVHITDIGGPAGGNPDTLDGRPSTPYTESATISSDSNDTALYRFSAQNYTFYKTIQFNPRGEANINSTSTLKHVGEIGMKPTHGTVVDTNTTNIVAVQFTGVSGSTKIYRK
jgi:prepilin-type N-terminal cleavage/methylation domain-containing protein